MGKSRSVQQDNHCAKRIDRAHRRYLQSIKMLATVRRLLTPAVLMQFGVHAHQLTHHESEHIEDERPSMLEPRG